MICLSNFQCQVSVQELVDRSDEEWERVTATVNSVGFHLCRNSLLKTVWTAKIPDVRVFLRDYFCKSLQFSLKMGALSRGARKFARGSGGEEGWSDSSFAKMPHAGSKGQTHRQQCGTQFVQK